MSSQPGYTEFPHYLLEAIAQMPDAAARIMLVIIRKTFGWRKDSDRISLTQFEKGTLLSRQGVQNGVVWLVKYRRIIRVQDGQYFSYTVNTNESQWMPLPARKTRQLSRPVETKVGNLVDQSTKLTSQLSRPVLGNLVDQLDPKLGNLVDTQKKEEKEKKEKEVGAAIAAAPATLPADPPSPKKQKAAPKAKKESDPRSNHPAITLVREITKRYPNALLYDELILALGDSPDIAKATAAYRAWIGRGFNPSAMTPFTEWYVNGCPEPYKPNTNGHSKTEPDSRLGKGMNF